MSRFIFPGKVISVPGFDALYRQTVTLFNRIKDADGETYWFPTVLRGVHLIDSQSATWNSQGGARNDNAELRVRFQVKGGVILIAEKPYYEPKQYRLLDEPDKAITFSFGHNDDSDFFMEGEFDFDGAISDDAFDRHGFYNYMNKTRDGVYSIIGCSRFDLIPHFSITAR